MISFELRDDSVERTMALLSDRQQAYPPPETVTPENLSVFSNIARVPCQASVSRERPWRRS